MSLETLRDLAVLLSLPGPSLFNVLEAQLLDAGIQRSRLHSEQLCRATGTINSTFAPLQCSQDIFAIEAPHFLRRNNLDFLIGGSRGMTRLASLSRRTIILKIEMERAGAGSNHCAFNDVLQLTNVPRPIAVKQLLKVACGQYQARAIETLPR